MTKQLSFTKYEHKILPNFRQKINFAESTEDVKKFFVQTTKKLLEEIFEGKMVFQYDDFKLQVDTDPYYSFSDRLHSSEIFNSVWDQSDLSRMVGRLAESAIRRHKHLLRSPEKTDSKIRIK